MSYDGWVNIEESAALLRSIFPNYPDLSRDEKATIAGNRRDHATGGANPSKSRQGE